jgi:coenzyme F420-reducing hydrogenase alpha subunit
VREGQVERAELSIYEPPRFFEALRRGRAHTAADITARICGICPVAYQMSACRAIEHACGVAVPDPITDLRRLLYCGEWISSHTLPPAARRAAADAGLGPASRNPFRSIVVRAVEVVCAVEEALRLIEAYEPPTKAPVPVPPRPGVGHGVTEAPRGLLYHRYELDDAGLVRSATVVPPTAQKQDAIEDDLRWVIGANLHLDDASLTALCERAIRNHDPCISCAAHFLDLTVDRW